MINRFTQPLAESPVSPATIASIEQGGAMGRALFHAPRLDSVGIVLLFPAGEARRRGAERSAKRTRSKAESRVTQFPRGLKLVYRDDFRLPRGIWSIDVARPGAGPEARMRLYLMATSDGYVSLERLPCAASDDDRDDLVERLSDRLDTIDPSGAADPRGARR